jgi:hypothetical protein
MKGNSCNSGLELLSWLALNFEKGSVKSARDMNFFQLRRTFKVGHPSQTR